MYQNYDEMIKGLAKDYVDYLVKKGMTYKEYDLILSTGFASRVCFFEKICAVREVRKYVLNIMMQEYSDSLNPIEEKFIEKYNDVCELIGLPKFEKESFFEMWNDSENEFERNLYKYEDNRIARYVDNCQVAGVAKIDSEYLEEKKEFSDRVKEKAANIVYEILYMASDDKSLWKDA